MRGGVPEEAMREIVGELRLIMGELFGVYKVARIEFLEGEDVREPCRH